MTTKIELGLATTGDYPGILALNEAAVPNVNSIDAGVLENLHEQSLLLAVARDTAADDPAIAGFLLALPETATYGSINFGYFKSRYPNFAYVDRVVVNAGYRRGGIGRQLYAFLIESAQRKERITCEVNVRPPNPVSLSFHTSLGFAAVAEQDTEGGAKRVALMVRESNSFSG